MITLAHDRPIRSNAARRRAQGVGQVLIEETVYDGGIEPVDIADVQDTCHGSLVNTAFDFEPGNDILIPPRASTNKTPRESRSGRLGQASSLAKWCPVRG
jgi:hypothetical protein